MYSAVCSSCDSVVNLKRNEIEWSSSSSCGSLRETIEFAIPIPSSDALQWICVAVSRKRSQLEPTIALNGASDCRSGTEFLRNILRVCVWGCAKIYTDEIDKIASLLHEYRIIISCASVWLCWIENECDWDRPRSELRILSVWDCALHLIHLHPRTVLFRFGLWYNTKWTYKSLSVLKF